MKAFQIQGYPPSAPPEGRKETLAPNNMKKEILNVPPKAMTQKFTANEIQKVAKKLNNDKSCGPDQLHAEYIKQETPPQPYSMVFFCHFQSQVNQKGHLLI